MGKKRPPSGPLDRMFAQMYKKENRGLFFDCVCYIGNRIMVKGRVNV